MAKTKIENTREHDIVLAVAKPGGEILSVTVPAAKEEIGPNGTEKINGVALVEDELLELAKDKEVIQHYFNEGWLRAIKGKANTKAVEKPAEGGAPAAPAGNQKAPWNTDAS